MTLRILGIGTALLGLVSLPSSAVAGERMCPLPGQPTAESYTWNFSEEAADLLARVESQASTVSDHAEKLAQFANRPELSWRSHARELTAIREEVNDMGRNLCRLQAIRHTVSPWQRQAINRVTPLLATIAQNTERAVMTLNDNHNTLWSTDYSEYVADLSDDSSQLARTVSDFREYARLHRELRQVRTDLGMETGS